MQKKLKKQIIKQIINHFIFMTHQPFEVYYGYYDYLNFAYYFV